jgi:hypothetical protein
MTVEKKAIDAEVLDGLLAGYQKPEDLIGVGARTELTSGCNVCSRPTDQQF